MRSVTTTWLCAESGSSSSRCATCSGCAGQQPPHVLPAAHSQRLPALPGCARCRFLLPPQSRSGTARGTRSRCTRIQGTTGAQLRLCGCYGEQLHLALRCPHWHTQKPGAHLKRPCRAPLPTMQATVLPQPPTGHPGAQLLHFSLLPMKPHLAPLPISCSWPSGVVR